MATATIGDNSGNTYAGTEDTLLKSTAATTNYGAQTTALDYPQKYGSGDHGHGLVKFSGLSNIAGPVTVSSATLRIFPFGGSIAGNQTISIRRVLRNWVEAQATWNIYSTGNSWTTAGCLSDGNDRSSTVSATATVAAVDFGSNYMVFTSAQLATDIADMINNPSTNYGWHVERTDAANDSTYIQAQASEGTNAQRPYLDITYTAGGATTPLTFTGSDSLAGGELL